MIITGFGISCFRIETKGLSIVFDPPRQALLCDAPPGSAEPGERKKSGKNPPRASARESRGLKAKAPRALPDLLLITHEHPDHANRALAGTDTFVISSPGEYEFRSIPITGIATFHDRESGSRLGWNTTFVLECEEMRICHLGDLADRRHIGMPGESKTTLEELVRPCDILFIPCGGRSVLGPNEAAELTRAIRPKLVIPMHAPSFTPFAASLGTKLERALRLAIRPSDLPKEGWRLVTIAPGNKEKA